MDGQHRLAGIKKAVGDGLADDNYDEVSVILVGHQDGNAGLKRTQRLFTTLNKTARPVSKGEIIALDEDDVMAICVRRLIEKTQLFSDDRLEFVASSKMPVSNKTSLTTIGNLYDVLAMLFTEAQSDLKRKKGSLQRIRPSDELLDRYFSYANDLFTLLRERFGELSEFFSATDTRPVVKRHRGPHGGSALFRPVGLEVFAKIIARATKDRDLNEAVRFVEKLPRNLHEKPFKSVIWDPQRQRIMRKNKAILREVLSYMLGFQSTRYSEEKLLIKYRQCIGDTTEELPERVV